MLSSTSGDLVWPLACNCGNIQDERSLSFGESQAPRSVAITVASFVLVTSSPWTE